MLEEAALDPKLQPVGGEGALGGDTGAGVTGGAARAGRATRVKMRVGAVPTAQG
jgi:hypothetical protein